MLAIWFRRSCVTASASGITETAKKRRNPKGWWAKFRGFIKRVKYQLFSGSGTNWKYNRHILRYEVDHAQNMPTYLPVINIGRSMQG
jgi:hypothetical protein